MEHVARVPNSRLLRITPTATDPNVMDYAEENQFSLSEKREQWYALMVSSLELIPRKALEASIRDLAAELLNITARYVD